MRIVHEIETPTQVGGSPKPYGCPLGWQGYNGQRVEILIAQDCAGNNPELPTQLFDDEPTIYIEGDAKHVREALQRALSMIDATEDYFKQSMGELRKAKCPECLPDDVQPNVSHLCMCPMHPNYAKFKAEGLYGLTAEGEL